MPSNVVVLDEATRGEGVIQSPRVRLVLQRNVENAGLSCGFDQPGAGTLRQLCTFILCEVDRGTFV
jgi:hypothetical protein